MKKIVYLSGIPLVLIFILILLNFNNHTEKATTASKSKYTKQSNMIKTPTLYNINNDEVLSFEFNYNVEGFIDFAAYFKQDVESQIEPINHNGRGIVHFKFTENVGYGWDVLGVINVYKLIQQDYEIKNINDLRFSFRMSKKGVIDSAVFDSEKTEEIAQIILDKLQIILPSQSKKQWRTIESDSLGRFYANYKFVEDTIKKEKTNYVDYSTNTLDLAWEQANLTTKITKSSLKAIINEQLEWVSSVVLTEQVENYINDKVSDSVSVAFNAELITDAPLVTFKKPTQYDKNSTDKVLGMQKYYQTLPELNVLAQNMETRDALDKFIELLENENNETLAIKFIINYLRLNPMATFELLDYLDSSEELSHSASLRLWYAISEAGHKEAQQALVKAFLSDGYSDLIKMRALSVVHDLEYPTNNLVQQTFEFSQGSISDDQELIDMAMFALGSLADPNKLNEEQTNEAVDLLRTELTKSVNDPERAQSVLIAISNSANPKLVKDVVAMIESENDDVRTESLLALMKIPSESSKDAFYSAIDRETKFEVKYEVYKSLAQRDSADMLTWASKKVLEDIDGTNKALLIHYIGRNLSESNNAEQLLRSLLSQEQTSLEQKKTIYNYISAIPENIN